MKYTNLYLMEKLVLEKLPGSLKYFTADDSPSIYSIVIGYIKIAYPTQIWLPAIDYMNVWQCFQRERMADSSELFEGCPCFQIAGIKIIMMPKEFAEKYETLK